MLFRSGAAYIGISADDRAVGDLDALVEDLRSGFAAVTGVQVGSADPYAADPYSADQATPGDTPPEATGH